MELVSPITIGPFLAQDRNAAEGRNQTRLTASRRRLCDVGVTHALCADVVAFGLPLNERCIAVRACYELRLYASSGTARKKWPLRGSCPRRTRKKRCIPLWAVTKQVNKCVYNIDKKLSMRAIRA